ncbi:MAG: N-acetylglucosamine-6-phosphate deacetylase [Mycoplasmataceae bacterium]|nr:N-acetylglucosamine-6-phosphate deacetylase [Mycoplasmataceae bacterium]
MKIKGLNFNNEAIEVEIKDGKIVEIKTLTKTKLTNYIIPGFIDNHTHGGYGFDWIDANKTKTLKYLKEVALKEGTTSVCGTTITTAPEIVLKAIETNKELVNEPLNGANLIGFHLEGPFINPLKKGAHPIQYMKPLTKTNLFAVIGSDNLKYFKIITFAPELSTVKDVTEIIKEHELNLQVGHSVARKKDVKKYLKHNLRGITHFNNAMIKYDTRDSSLAKWGLKTKELYIEFINDGVHNSLELAQNIYLNKPKDKVMLITDSLHVKGLADGDYQGPNWKITKRDGAAFTPEGVLNGSTYTMHNAFKDWIKMVGATMEEAILVTSTNQAKYLGLNKGKIEIGYDADILVLDQKLEIKQVIVNGKEIK